MTRDPGTLAASDLPLPRPPGYTPRRDGGLGAYEVVLGRAGFAPVAGIVGLNEAVAETDRVRELVASCPAGFVVLSGDDATALAAVAAGARGVISVTANVAPRAMSQMLAAALRGDAGRAAELDASLSALHRELFVETNPIPVKWLLAHMGLIGPGIRLPLTPLAAEHSAGLLAAARAAGLLA